MSAQRPRNDHRSNLVLLFGAGADMDALKKAIRGDRLLLETFRNLETAKENEEYLAAFAHLFGSEPKLSYSWKSSVKDMIRRALRNRPREILSCDESVALDFGNLSIPVCKDFLAVMQDTTKPRAQARKLLFHMVAAVYGAVSVGQLQAAAANRIHAGLGNAGVHMPDDLYNEINLHIHYDPEKVLTESAITAIENYLQQSNVDDELASIVVRLLDYTVVFDNVFSDLTTDRDQLTSPSGHTAPLRRALHFLFSLKITASQMDAEIGRDSYYHRIPEDAAVFTMNYTTAVERVLRGNQSEMGRVPVFLHGRHTELFDLLTGELNPETGGIPFLMPQTSSKPVASVETIRRLSAFLRATDNAKRLVTVGYGFNRDDDHVNNMIFDCMLRNPELEVTIVVRDTTDGSDGVARLKNRFPNRIHIERVSYDVGVARDRFEEIVTNE
jgi:hypothetical protein